MYVVFFALNINLFRILREEIINEDFPSVMKLVQVQIR